MTRIVIDSNILFSALIRDSTTRRIILEYPGRFIFPEYVFEELERHKHALREKSGLTEEEFSQLLAVLLEKVEVAPKEALLRYRRQAMAAVKDIDPDDTVFVAATLANPKSILWTDDKKLKQITTITVKNTAEILDYLKK